MKIKPAPNLHHDTEINLTSIVRVSVATPKAPRIQVAHEDTSIQKRVEELIKRELGLRCPLPKRVLGNRPRHESLVPRHSAP